MTFVRSRNISLKCQRFTTLGFKDIGIRKSEFVAKSQFLCKNLTYPQCLKNKKAKKKKLSKKNKENQKETKQMRKKTKKFSGF